MSRKLELIIEEHNTVLYADIEDNPRLNDAIPLSTREDNQLARDVDGYYVPPTSWEDVTGKPNSTIEEIDDAVSRSEQNESSIESLEQGKVDKVVGKELSSNDFTDALKGKLEALENFDDSAIQAELANKVDKVAGKGLSTEDFTTAEKSKLAALENFDDSAIYAELDTKVDKVAGKQLSTEDFTTAEKSKLAELEKFDDTLRQDLADPDKGAVMVAYGDGTVADKLDEIGSGGAGGGSVPVEWIEGAGVDVPLTDLSPDTMYIIDVRSGNPIGIMVPENHSNIPVGAEYHFVCAGDPESTHIYEDNIGEVRE